MPSKIDEIHKAIVLVCMILIYGVVLLFCKYLQFNHNKICYLSMVMCLCTSIVSMIFGHPSMFWLFMILTIEEHSNCLKHIIIHMF